MSTELMQVSATDTPFGKIRRQKAQKLNPSAAVKEYLASEEGLSLVAEYWSFSDEDIEANFTPSVVKELEGRLSAEKDEKKAIEILEQIRNYKRRLQFVGFSERSGVDPETGEESTLPVVNFYDSYTDGMVQMGQARIVGLMTDLEAQVRKSEATLEGVIFSIEFTGKKKNKNNSFKSDTFKVSPIETSAE